MRVVAVTGWDVEVGGMFGYATTVQDSGEAPEYPVGVEMDGETTEGEGDGE